MGDGGGIEGFAESIFSSFAYDTWYAVVLSFGFWALLYFFVRAKLPERNPEFCSRILTLAHGSLMAFYGLNECFASGSLYDDPAQANTQDQAFIIALSLGYFLLDLSWCLYHKSETALMIAHHIYSCFALSRLLFKGSGGHAASCGLGALEVTNPLLQARWFTRTFGYHDTPLFTSIEVTFIILFFLIRIALGSFYLMFMILQPKNSWEFEFLAGLIYIMSWMFMINICKYFMNKYVKDNVEAELGHINTS